MRNSKKLLVGASALVATAGITSVAVQEAEAADVTFTGITFDYNGEIVTESFDNFATAMLSEEGSFYEFIENHNIESLELSNGNYISLNSFATAMLEDDGRSVNEILEDLSSDSSAVVGEDEVATYTSIEGWNSDGTPDLGGVVPEVTDIY